MIVYVVALVDQSTDGLIGQLMVRLVDWWIAYKLGPSCRSVNRELIKLLKF